MTVLEAVTREREKVFEERIERLVAIGIIRSLSTFNRSLFGDLLQASFSELCASFLTPTP